MSYKLLENTWLNASDHYNEGIENYTNYFTRGRIRQLGRNPFPNDAKPKVFIIGFNKTGTSSLHYYFKRNGYNSSHYMEDSPLADTIIDNIRNNRKIFDNTTGDIFSDITWNLGKEGKPQLDAHDIYKIADLQYPGSLFILNIRPVNNWIKSRKKHGILLKDALNYSQYSEKDIEDWWKHQYEFYIKDVQLHFKNTNKLLVFDIENDSIDKVNNFVYPHYKLKSSLWSQDNITKH
jgi:hypothetical protein